MEESGLSTYPLSRAARVRFSYIHSMRIILAVCLSLCAGLSVVSRAAVPAVSKERLAKILADNDRAKAENALIEKANTALAAKDWAGASAALESLLASSPRWEYRWALGDAKLNSGAYDEALAAYAAALKDARAAKPAVKREVLATMLTNEGNAYLKLKKTAEAMAAYEDAAKLSKSPAIAYFNLCAVAYNQGLMSDAEKWCAKSIAADPKKADAYFIKGSALYGDGKLDKDNKYILPPGTLEALHKYLELAPEGAHAGDVKAMIDAAGPGAK